MFSLVEVINYRCLRHVRQELDRFHILVGPNASGKSTFLDAIDFVADMIRDGLRQAVAKRSTAPRILMWNDEPTGFQIALEARIPEEIRKKLEDPSFTRCRYEIIVGFYTKRIKESIGILSELLSLHRDENTISQFPLSKSLNFQIADPYINPKCGRLIVHKRPDGKDVFYSETTKQSYEFKLGYEQSALVNVPEDESLFPVAVWFRNQVLANVNVISLNCEAMKKTATMESIVGEIKEKFEAVSGKDYVGTMQNRMFKPDGSNLADLFSFYELIDENGVFYNNWLDHIKTALPTVQEINFKLSMGNYLFVIKYENGLCVPSWALSDGTLRLLALTLLAYLPNLTGTFLIEEPENGLHPQAIETVYQSLSSVYNAQVMVTTHSPVMLSVAEPREILCFSKDEEGATQIVSGDKHPALKDWHGEVNLSVYFASGVLG